MFTWHLKSAEAGLNFTSVVDLTSVYCQFFVTAHMNLIEVSFPPVSTDAFFAKSTKKEI